MTVKAGPMLFGLPCWGFRLCRGLFNSPWLMASIWRSGKDFRRQCYNAAIP